MYAWCLGDDVDGMTQEDAAAALFFEEGTEWNADDGGEVGGGGGEGDGECSAPDEADGMMPGGAAGAGTDGGGSPESESSRAEDMVG